MCKRMHPSAGPERMREHMHPSAGPEHMHKHMHPSAGPEHQQVSSDEIGIGEDERRCLNKAAACNICF